MNVLQTARVLVIDDQPTEAMPIIKALGLLGIGCVHIAGDKVEELKKFKALKGIRLAFVDMRLGTYGTSKEAVPVTVNVVKKVIHENSMPILFVAWTQHQEDVDLFTQMLSTELPSITPVSVRLMEKPFNGNLIDAKKTYLGVKRTLSEMWPVGALWCWEQMSHDATTDTAHALSSVVSTRSQGGDANAWNKALGEVLRLLIAIGSGQSNEVRYAAHGLINVFNHLHLDCLNHGNVSPLRRATKRLLENKPSKLSSAEMATLNTMLVLLPVDKKDRSVRPGNLYVPRGKIGVLCPHRRCKPDVFGLGEDILNFNSNAEVKTLEDKLKAKANQAANKQRTLRRNLTQKKMELVKECRPVLLEVTPTCDYDQNTQKVARFVGGLLVPDSLYSLIKARKESLRQLGCIALTDRSGVWHPVFSGRFPYSIGKPEKSIKSVPIGRMCDAVLVDIQAWFAAQSARPGHLIVPKL
jgi:hypothetical protein